MVGIGHRLTPWINYSQWSSLSPPCWVATLGQLCRLQLGSPIYFLRSLFKTGKHLWDHSWETRKRLWAFNFTFTACSVSVRGQCCAWLRHSLQSEWQHVSNDFHLSLAEELLFWGCPNTLQAGGALGTELCVYVCVGLGGGCLSKQGSLLTFYGWSLVLGSIQHILESLMGEVKKTKSLTVNTDPSSAKWPWKQRFSL